MQGGHGRHSDISGWYGVLLAVLTVVTLPSKIIKSCRFRTRGRLSLGDALLKRLARHLQDMAAARRPCIQPEHAMVRQRHLTRQRQRPAPDQPYIRDRLVGARHGRVVTNAVRSPVRPATR
jgi:hypothetical protein